jgi:type IV secretion system protein VirD4
MSAADIAALPKTDAVLISTGRKPKIRMLPWYTERDTAAITSYAAEAADAVRSAAIAAQGPDNPLARQLLAEQQRGDEQTTRHEGTVR